MRSDLEIRQILEEEKRQYEKDKAVFEANPLHWSNNKRRRNGLAPIRGKCNKNRVTRFHSFKSTPRFFFLIEDIIDEVIGERFNDGYFEQFVEVKNVPYGDSILW